MPAPGRLRPASAGSRAQPRIPRTAPIEGPPTRVLLRSAGCRLTPRWRRPAPRCSRPPPRSRARCFRCSRRWRGPKAPMPAPKLDEAEHDLCFSILFAARQTSRQSAYQARLLVRPRGRRHRAVPRVAVRRAATARVRTRRRAVRIPRAALVLATAFHGDAPGTAPPADADGASARRRAAAGRSAGRRSLRA